MTNKNGHKFCNILNYKYITTLKKTKTTKRLFIYDKSMSINKKFELFELIERKLQKLVNGLNIKFFAV